MLHGVAARRNQAMMCIMKVYALSISTIVTKTTNEDIGFPSREVGKTLKSSSEWLPSEPQNQEGLYRNN